MSRPALRPGHTAVVTPDLDRFRRFYEDVIGLRMITVDHPIGAPFRRLAAFADSAGTSVVLLAFEVPGYESGLPEDIIGRRGRIDHFAFAATDDASFDEAVARLVDAGASSGEVSILGPTRSVLFVDPDGGHRNLQTWNREWSPGTTTEVVDPDLLQAIRSS